MSQYKRNSIANSQYISDPPYHQMPKRHSQASVMSQPHNGYRRASSIAPSLKSVALNHNQDKMAQIEGLYSSTNADVMVYEVEIVDPKLEQELQIRRAAEKGLCICRRWHFLLAGNLVIFILMAVAIGVTMILNTPKDTSKVPLSINDTCTAGSTDCDIKADLKCPSGTCICNSNKYWNGTDCVCGFNLYWDGYNCLTNKNYTEKCTTDIPCLDYMYCNGSICQCTYTKYWKNNTCVNKVSINSTCTSYMQCQDYLGLTCTSGKCACGARYYWDSSKTQCVSKKLNGSSCTENAQCDDTVTLYCTKNGSQTMCLCNSTWYWDLSLLSCQPTKPYYEPCIYNYECIQEKSLICQPSTITAANSCDCPYTSAANTCDCPMTRFWDYNTCALRNTVNGSCVADYACTANSNLKCSFGFCVCQSPYPTWNGSKCV